MNGFRAFVFLVVCLLGSDSAFSLDGVFDRSAEVEKYIQVMKTGTYGAATEVAKEIYWSGISDRQLAEAIKERLFDGLEEMPDPNHSAIRGPRFTWTVAETHSVSMIRALASLGLPEYNSTLDDVERVSLKNKKKYKRVLKEVRQAAALLELRSGMNELMASRENHVDGGEPVTSRLINLLKSEDRLYRDFALDRIQREKMRDPRLLDFLESQVIEYIDRAPVAKLDWQEVFIRRNIKLLGLSGDVKYRETMERVLSSDVDAGAKKYAQVALNEPIRDFVCEA